MLFRSAFAELALLSKDVEFKNLGLLIVDEEQRFGVTHKEKIKQMKKDVDVLTLTATPIPRTLHMSLVGIRDMSVLEEAPMDRMPIQTYVMEYDEEMVREAIKRELSRGGQVYYVFNRVNQIADMTAKISELVPEASASICPCCCAPSRLPAPRISRSFMAILNPLPSSENSRIADNRFSATSRSILFLRYIRNA